MKYWFEEIELPDGSTVLTLMREDGRYIVFENIEKLFDIADHSEELLDAFFDLIDKFLVNTYGYGIPS